MKLHDPKTPLRRDKRIGFAAAVILALILCAVFGVTIPDSLVWAISSISIAAITNSAAKEAAVARANAAAIAVMPADRFPSAE